MKTDKDTSSGRSRIPVIQTKPMKMHDEDEPLYGDGRGHYWYEGEEIEIEFVEYEGNELNQEEMK